MTSYCDVAPTHEWHGPDSGIIRNRLKGEWVKLFKQTFRFTGGEIVGEFLMRHRLSPRGPCPQLSGLPRSPSTPTPWSR